MNKELGLAIQKAYNDSSEIIRNSTNEVDCYDSLKEWLGCSHTIIDNIILNYTKIKKKLDKLDKE